MSVPEQTPLASPPQEDGNGAAEKQLDGVLQTQCATALGRRLLRAQLLKPTAEFELARRPGGDEVGRGGVFGFLHEALALAGASDREGRAPEAHTAEAGYWGALCKGADQEAAAREGREAEEEAERLQLLRAEGQADEIRPSAFWP